MTLSRDRMQALRQALEQRYDELRKLIGSELLASDEESYIELAGRVHDAADASVADLIEDVTLVNIDRHVNEVRAIEQALAAMEQGTYGECSECGTEIEFERLQAIPWAVRCHDCQQKWEREHLTDARHGSSL